MIAICDECGQYFCPSACPNFSFLAKGMSYPRKACSRCGDDVCRGENYYLYGENILCADCADELFPIALADFLGCDSTEEFFKMLCISKCEA